MPESTTNLTPRMVREVSATFVAKITFLKPVGASSNTCLYSSIEIFPCKASVNAEGF